MNCGQGSPYWIDKVRKGRKKGRQADSKKGRRKEKEKKEVENKGLKKGRKDK